MHKKFYLGLPLMVALYFCLQFTGCQSGSSNGKIGETALEVKGSSNSYDHTDLLSLNLLINDAYCQLTACECIHYLASREYEEVLALLKKEYNIELNLTYCIEEYYLEDSIKTMRFDGVICKPWTAFQFQADMGMKFKRIVDVIDPFENSFLSGIFIVRNESPIQEAKDIVGRRLVIGQENSFEKYHAILPLLEKEGIEPSSIKRVSACTEGINALLDKVADVAVISDYALVATCAVDLAEDDAFRTVWQTKDMPLTSLMLDLNKVSKKEAQRLQAALLDISNEKIPESFASNGFTEPMPWTPIAYVEEVK